MEKPYKVDPYDNGIGRRVTKSLRERLREREELQRLAAEMAEETYGRFSDGMWALVRKWQEEAEVGGGDADQDGRPERDVLRTTRGDKPGPNDRGRVVYPWSRRPVTRPSPEQLRKREEIRRVAIELAERTYDYLRDGIRDLVGGRNDEAGCGDGAKESGQARRG